MMARAKRTNGNGHEHAADTAAAVVLEAYGRTGQDGLVYRWLEKLEVDRQDAEHRLALDGGTAVFPGLYLGDQRLPARLVDVDGCDFWLVRPDAIQPEWRQPPFDTAFPDAARGVIMRLRVQAGHCGLAERDERAPAHAVIAGRLLGPGSCEAYIAIRRTDGDTWGANCEPCMTLEQAAERLAVGAVEVAL